MTTTHQYTVSPTGYPCPYCEDGIRWTSRYGGNDPDVWPVGPCDMCDGTGERVCDECGERPARTHRLMTHGVRYLCLECHEEWMRDE